MKLTSIDRLLSQQTENPRNLPMAVAGAADIGVLEAVVEAKKAGIITGLLFGNKEQTELMLTEFGEDINDYQIFHTETEEESAKAAVAAVKEGKARFIMKGLLNTATLLKAIVNKETGLRTGGVISHLMLMELPGYDKVLGITDVGIIPLPNLEQKQGIIENAVQIFNNLGYEKPKVAALSYVENVNEKIAETVEARELQKLNEAGKIRDCIIEGPLSFDIAMSKHRAEIKGYKGEVPGEADILLMPNISAGNILVKALGQFVPDVKSVAFAIGAGSPIVLTSRATPAKGKFNSILAAAAACGD